MYITDYLIFYLNLYLLIFSYTFRYILTDHDAFRISHSSGPQVIFIISLEIVSVSLENAVRVAKRAVICKI